MKQHYTMQKLLALCLIFSMTLAILAGCKKEEQNPAGTISDFESQAHFQPGTSGDDSASGDTSKAPLTGEFVVSDKKYDYKDANLVLLYVENQTNRHYNVTVKGKYLDENGEMIKEEIQTFEGFPSGWSNHFIFYPKTKFDSFTYFIETEECTGGTLSFDSDGNPLASYIEFSYEKNLHWQRGLDPINDQHPDNAKEIRELMFNGRMTNEHTNVTIAADFHLLILDTNGEIWATDYDYREYGNSHFATEPKGAVEEYYGLCPIRMQEVGEDETIPENVQGVFTAIFAVIDVLDQTRLLEQVQGNM